MSRKLMLAFSLIVTFSITSTSFAEQTINANNQKRCVEYFIKDGKSYCNDHMTQPSPDLLPAFSALPIAPTFDGRPWQLNWWNQKPGQPMMEYGLKGEAVGAWSELVTTQFFPKLQLTPQQFMARMMQVLQ